MPKPNERASAEGGSAPARTTASQAMVRSRRQLDWVGVAGCAGAMIAVGGSVAVSGLITGYPVYAGQAMRYTAAALMLGVVALLRERWVWPTGRQWLRLTALAGAGLVIFNVVIIEALRTAEPAVVGVVLGATPIVLAVAGPLQEGRRPNAQLVAAAGVVVLGAAIVQGVGRTTWTGFVLSLVALACEAAFSLLAVRLLIRLGPVRTSLYTVALAAAMLTILALFASPGNPFPTPTAAEIAAFAYLVVIVTAVAFLAWYSGVQRLGVERAGLFAGLLPVSTLLVAALVGTGTVTVVKLIGVFVVAGGLTWGFAQGTSRVGGLR